MATFTIEFPDALADLVKGRTRRGRLMETSLEAMLALYRYEECYRYGAGECLRDDELAALVALFQDVGRYIQRAHGVGRAFVSDQESQRRQERAKRGHDNRRKRAAAAEVHALPSATPASAHTDNTEREQGGAADACPMVPSRNSLLRVIDGGRA